MADLKPPAVVPFGKYKGQPVEALSQDRAYCEWLMGQDWFRTRFVGIHTLIVNHFGEATETPEHNALQARFLDQDWCQRFCAAMGLVTQLERMWKADIRDYAAFMANPRLPEDREGLENYAQEYGALLWSFGILDRQFEHEGIDVTLMVSVYSERPIVTFYELETHYSLNGKSMWIRREPRVQQFSRTYKIECKPRVGDDYPAILRQMRASGAKALLVGAVESVAVSLDQMRDIFDTAGITICTVEEIESTPPLWAPRE